MVQRPVRYNRDISGGTPRQGALIAAPLPTYPFVQLTSSLSQLPLVVRSQLNDCTEEETKGRLGVILNLLSCFQNTGATHTNSDGKVNLTLEWTAPDTDEGDLVFT